MARFRARALRPPQRSSSPEGLSRQLEQSMRVVVAGSNPSSRVAEHEKERALLAGAVSTCATGCLVQRESGDVSQAVRPGMAGPGPHLFSEPLSPRIFTDSHGSPKTNH